MDLAYVPQIDAAVELQLASNPSAVVFDRTAAEQFLLGVAVQQNVAIGRFTGTFNPQTAPQPWQLREDFGLPNEDPKKFPQLPGGFIEAPQDVLAGWSSHASSAAIKAIARNAQTTAEPIQVFASLDLGGILDDLKPLGAGIVVSLGPGTAIAGALNAWNTDRVRIEKADRQDALTAKLYSEAVSGAIAAGQPIPPIPLAVAEKARQDSSGLGLGLALGLGAAAVGTLFLILRYQKVL